MTTVSQILLVDDHPLVRSGIELALIGQSDLHLAGSAENGDHAIEQVIRLQPDLLLLDLKIPGSSPFVVIAETRTHSPQTKILIISAYDDSDYLQRLQVLGIDGYILKEEAPELLLAAIRTILQGATWFSRKIVGTLFFLNKRLSLQSQPWTTFTPREQTLLLCLSKGWNNYKIASELNLAEQTVRNYISRLYEKMGVQSRAQAMVWLRGHPIPPHPESE